MNWKTPCLMLLLLYGTNLLACSSIENKIVQQTNSKKDTMRIRIIVDDNIFTATLYSNPTSNEFISLLPLSLTLQDYNSTEKISDLPKRLTTKDAPAGYKPLPGDITIYAPWGNLALFYKDFPYSNGLIVIGKLDGGIDIFNMPGPLNIRIELDKYDSKKETK